MAKRKKKEMDFSFETVPIPSSKKGRKFRAGLDLWPPNPLRKF